MGLRFWPRKFIQPSYAVASRRRMPHDECVGETLVFGLFLLIGVFALASTATGWHDAPRNVRSSPDKLAYSGKHVEKAVVRADVKRKRRVLMLTSRQSSPQQTRLAVAGSTVAVIYSVKARHEPARHRQGSPWDR